MTKFAYCSDIHLEMGSRDFDLPEADVLLLGGDICVGDDLNDSFTSMGLNQRQFFKDVSAKYKQVIYIPGNHEHYSGCIDNTVGVINDFLREENLRNIICNDYGSYTVDSIKIVYATMWTDLNKGNPLVINSIQSSMNDYIKIMIGDSKIGSGVRYITPMDIMHTHATHRDHIAKEVSNTDGKVVVLTHHAPLLNLTGGRGNNQGMDYGYGCTDMEGIIYENDISHWIFGHCHTRSSTEIDGTKFLSNCRGYRGFEETASFTIKTFDV